LSTLKLDRARARIRKAMSIAPQERFLLMLWAVEALRSGHPEIAARFIQFTAEQAKQAVGDTNAIFPWELETLAIQSLLVPRQTAGRFYRCEDFGTAGNFTNMLRHLEDQEFGATSKAEQIDIFIEMHRIGQRQFPWQRGGPNLADFYRPLYLYGQGRCAEYFAEAHGLTINDFSLVGFALFALFSSRPYVIRPPNLSELKLTSETIEAGLRLLSVPVDSAGAAQRELLRQTKAATWPIAYQPSVLRQFPVLSLDGRPKRLTAPVPILVLQRVTFGIYYDLTGDGGNLRNEIAGRFEQYSADFIRAMMPGFTVEREYHYDGKRKGAGYDSPDILVEDAGELAIVIECKATKLTFSAKFSDDPAADAKARYAEIGRGIFQLWRYFAHCRLGLTGRALTDGTAGIVLTLDTWLVMARSLQDHVLAVASALADVDADITAADRRPIAFAAVQDFERLLSQSDEAEVRAALAAAHEDRFSGWLLPSVDQELHGASRKRKRYPFRPDEIVPWWTRFDGGQADGDDEDEAA
jgi:hypothetical protein